MYRPHVQALDLDTLYALGLTVAGHKRTRPEIRSTQKTQALIISESKTPEP